MRKKSLYIIVAIVVLVACMLTVSALADAGNFSGGSDYGGSWGGSSDWGSDWSSSGGGSYSGDSSGGAIVFAVIFIIVIAVFIQLRKKGLINVGTSMPQASFNLQPISLLREKDPNFSEEEMKEKIANLYVRMQQAWQDKNFEPMRPYFTDALYGQFSRQLEAIARAGQTNYVERIAVLDVTLNGWSEDEANDTIVATISTRIVDYTLEDKTGKLVSGSKTAEKFMVYEYSMVRSKGMVTPEKAGEGRDGTVEISCPSCGAPVEINQSAKCSYCGSIITAKDYDWSISAIKGISQRTAGK